MVQSYKFINSDEDDVTEPLLVTPFNTQERPIGQEPEHHYQPSADGRPDGEPPQEGVATKKEVRGAGVAGGLIGLVIGGPVLAVIGGFAAAAVAKSDSKAGRFARKSGNRVSHEITRGCKYVTEKIQSNKRN